ncbi:P-loop containing nucleoside triphosphate hydrolase protein [Trametes meyenii]|nr:P-loop containing nucleoside triphosphate hydrolase protein [Trametes meyenii]
MLVKRVFQGTEGIYSSLKDFLPAGVVIFELPTPTHSFNAEESLAEDGWRTFPQAVHGFPDDGPGGLESISFLVRHRFVAATYNINSPHAQLFVRLYVIPWDLSGSRGELRSRDEDNVLKPGRKCLKQVFRRIRQDRSLWDGDAASSSNAVYFINQAADNRTLLDIYNTLPSPSAEPLEGDIPGLRTNLYRYQRRSVATMIARETSGGSVEHPLYVPIKGVDGKVFFMQPATMEILSNRPRVSAVPGGILCEELGTGKTIMILSLILATLDHIASPEEGIYEERTPLTPIALRHFQTASVNSERAKLKKPKTPDNHRFPSLVDIILHKCRVDPAGIPLRDPDERERLENLGLWEPLRANAPFYLHSETPPETTGRRARQQTTSGPRVMYLTSATLVIVPDNLRRQWANEILKHCTDLLHVLLVDDKHPIPDAPLLATDYDIVLMSQSQFSQESKKKDVKSLYSPIVCKCEPEPGTLVTRCWCSRRSGVSPLLQVRWKRLVVDEGHNTAEKRTEYAIFTKLLSVERRWIVTGTPTTNLLGINFGSGYELQYPEDGHGLQQATEQRAWHSDERPDLRKLGNMLADFLKMMPFASSAKSFATLVSDPLFHPNLPFPGDIDVLIQVMSSIMVRHRIEDVESEVRLAILSHKTVMMDMDPLAVKTYNLIQATIAVNAVDSERKDQDYLFHPRNASHLQELVSNISHVMFWHVVDSGLEERLHNAQRSLENLSERDGTPDDFELIKQSITHLRTAMDDPVWIALQNQYHIFHRVDKMPPTVYRAWSTFPEYAQQAAGPAALLSPIAMLALYQRITERPLSDLNKIIEMGKAWQEREQAYKEVLRLHEQSKKKSRRERNPSESSRKAKSLDPIKRASAKEKMQELQRETEAALARLRAAFSGEEDVLLPSGDRPGRAVASSLLGVSPVAGVRIRNSTSTKLDYILNEVLSYGSDEKFLIFSESPATLSFIAEAFDLCRIKYLSFSGQQDREARQSMITTFETSDLYRVLLLELKYGARGLNLVSASRVIFCEPVWKADVESQAIKRVHRIGQLRPMVHVTTLAIRSTFEEVMVARSKALRENKQEFAKAATDDRTIRDFIEHPVFLPVPRTADRLVDLDIPLFDVVPPPQPTSEPQPSIMAEGSESLPGARAEDSSEPPRKKQKRVAFAD